jgi:hypothetical protein
MVSITRKYISRALTGNLTSAEALTALAGVQEDLVLSVFPCGPSCPAPSSSGMSTVTILIISFVCGIFAAAMLLLGVVFYYRWV